MSLSVTWFPSSRPDFPHIDPTREEFETVFLKLVVLSVSSNPSTGRTLYLFTTSLSTSTSPPSPRQEGRGLPETKTLEYGTTVLHVFSHSVEYDSMVRFVFRCEDTKSTPGGQL